MPHNEKSALAALFRDNTKAISVYLTEIFKENDFTAARTALGRVVHAQNVQILARDAGMRRDSLYRTFGGRIDPRLSRILKIYQALNIQAGVEPTGSRDQELAFPQEDLASIARNLTLAFDGNHFDRALPALKEVALGRNVSAMARASGIQRRTIYKTFGGGVDPQLGSILKLFAALRLRFIFLALPNKARPLRPKLGRPPKAPR